MNDLDRHKQFYYECREIIGTAMQQMCLRFVLKKYRISIEPESTADEYNNYELMRVSIRWYEGDNKCSLIRIINTYEIRESPLRYEILWCHVKVLNRQIQDHLDGKIP